MTGRTVPSWIVELVKLGDSAQSVDDLAAAWLDLEQRCAHLEPAFVILDHGVC